MAPKMFFDLIFQFSFFENEIIETHVRTFLPLNISAVGSVKMLHIWRVLFCSTTFHIKIFWEEHMSAELLRNSERFGNWCFLAHLSKPHFLEVIWLFWTCHSLILITFLICRDCKTLWDCKSCQNTIRGIFHFVFDI